MVLILELFVKVIFLIYNINKNIGIRYTTTNKNHAFSLNIDIVDKQLCISGSYIKLGLNDECQVYDTSDTSHCQYTKRCKSFYYHSRYCSWESERYQTNYYLNTYGDSPNFISNFLELIAKSYLNVDKCKEDIHAPSSYDSNSLSSDELEQLDCSENGYAGYCDDRSCSIGNDNEDSYN